MLYQEALQEFLPSTLKSLSTEALAALDYQEECEIKQKAFNRFWSSNRLDGTPLKIIESPLARNYRTTSKRRVTVDRCRVIFEGSGSTSFVLEPQEHEQIFSYLNTLLAKPAFLPLAYAMNWIIIRGSYTSRVVIFNVFKMDASIVRKMKQVVTHLQSMNVTVHGAHLYYDPTRSDYYLESFRPSDSVSLKHLFGLRDLTLHIEDIKLKYPVTGFSQINESQINNLIHSANEFAQISKDDTFLDLFCGYGLFSFTVGKNAKLVIGADWEGASIEYAKASARFLNKKETRFIAGKITSEWIESHLPPMKNESEIQLLDPPRQGTDPGVISSLAKRNPKRVVHVFCGTDVIPKELTVWNSKGYKIKKIQPLDLFPGTSHIETMVLLEK